MAYISLEQEGLSQEQADALRELNSFHLVSESFAWKKIREKLEAIADEAKEEMIGCAPETTMEQRGVLQVRWQQREAVKRELLTFVEQHVDLRNRLLEELKEQNGNESDNSRSNDQ